MNMPKIPIKTLVLDVKMSQIQADSVPLESLTQESSREMWEQLTSAPPS